MIIRIFLFFFLFFFTTNHPIYMGKNLFSQPRDNFYEVEKDAFYRSRQLSPAKLAFYIKKFRIKTIINLRGKNEQDTWWQQEKEVTTRMGVSFYNIAMSARRFPYKKDLLFLLNLYKNAPRPILVHCNGGADRTGEASALWVLDQQEKSRKEALRQLTFRYGHVRWQSPKKRQFIKMWRGREWAKNIQFEI